MKARFKIKEKDYVIRMAVILSALLAPYFCIFFAGFQQSLSAYWNTDMQPVFIFANAATSYYLFSIPNWRTSALCLLLVTAFSVDAYELTHNILAGVFFLLTIIPLYKSNHFRWTILLYLSAIFVFPYSMLGAEIVAITALCTYHSLLLRKVYNISR